VLADRLHAAANFHSALQFRDRFSAKTLNKAGRVNARKGASHQNIRVAERAVGTRRARRGAPYAPRSATIAASAAAGSGAAVTARPSTT
jgi:hypothetical protein